MFHFIKYLNIQWLWSIKSTFFECKGTKKIMQNNFSTVLLHIFIIPSQRLIIVNKYLFPLESVIADCAHFYARKS